MSTKYKHDGEIEFWFPEKYYKKLCQYIGVAIVVLTMSADVSDNAKVLLLSLKDAFYFKKIGKWTHVLTSILYICAFMA